MTIRRVPRVPHMTIHEISAKVNYIIRKYSPRTLFGSKPFPIYQFFDLDLERELNISIKIVESLGGFAEGETSDKEILVTEQIYRDAQFGKPRALVTLAHETAHAILHKSTLQILNASDLRARVRFYMAADIPESVNPEWQADIGAACILMPIPAIQQIAANAKSGRAEFRQQIKRTFNTSSIFTNWWLTLLREEGKI